MTKKISLNRTEVRLFFNIYYILSFIQKIDSLAPKEIMRVLNLVKDKDLIKNKTDDQIVEKILKKILKNKRLLSKHNLKELINSLTQREIKEKRNQVLALWELCYNKKVTEESFLEFIMNIEKKELI